MSERFVGWMILNLKTVIKDCRLSTGPWTTTISANYNICVCVTVHLQAQIFKATGNLLKHYNFNFSHSKMLDMHTFAYKSNDSTMR